MVAIDFDLTIKYHDPGLKMGMAHHFPEGDLPKSVRKVFDDQGWEKFKVATFEAVNKLGLSREALITGLNEDGGIIDSMDEVLRTASTIGDVVVISDSMTAFVECFLKYQGLENTVCKILAQPSEITEAGKIVAFDPPEDWRPDGCDFADRLMCKSRVMRSFLNTNQKSYDKIIFIGDGPNDFCPVKDLLSKNDLVFARSGFKLAKIIDSRKEEVEAKVLQWQSGKDILAALKEDGMIATF